MKYISVMDGVECERCNGTGFIESFDGDSLLESMIKCSANNCTNGIVLHQEYLISFDNLKEFLLK